MRLIKPMQESITWMWNGYLKQEGGLPAESQKNECNGQSACSYL